MNITQLLYTELEREANSTRKILKQVPEDHIEWRPHEKSFTLGRLSSHVAEMPQWLTWILTSDEYDIAKQPYERIVCKTNAELIHLFENKLKEGVSALQKTNTNQLEQDWIFRMGEHIISKTSRYEAIRIWMFNHHIHHRGQLGVYLRLLNIPIPGMYGPSADEMAKRKATSV